MSHLGLVTTAGKILRAQLLTQSVTWCALGTGNWADKENPPVEVVSATQLANEYARKRIARFAYLQEDDTLVENALGTIKWNGRKYKEVAGPTAITAFYTTFTEEEAVGVGITEIGLFGGSVITTTSPFALVANVVQKGTLYWYQHRPIFSKTGRDTYEHLGIFEER